MAKIPKKIRTGIFKNCIHCNEKYYIRKYQLKTSKYCSLKCKNKYNTIKVKINCKICDKEFSHISSRCNKAKYCSNKCRYESNKGRGLIEYSCIHCGVKFNDSPSVKRKYCSKKCVNKSYKNIWKAKFSTKLRRSAPAISPSVLP